MDYTKYYGFKFIKNVMTEPTLKQEEKEKFYRKVALPYINDTDFRDKVQGKLVVFQDGKLKAIVEDTETAYNLPGKKFAFYIGDNKKPLYSL
jgi:hypothetical protein